ncbi:hypothetical protein Tco_1256753 [Tanacetum coccineum]
MVITCTWLNYSRAPTVGYGDAIVCARINAETLSLKRTSVKANNYSVHDKDDPSLTSVISTSHFYDEVPERPGMEECLALADLGASINLMPLSVWKKLSLPELTLLSLDFDADPQVPLILGRYFLKTGACLDCCLRRRINESTLLKWLLLRVVMLKKWLGFSDVIASGNPTPYYDPIVSTSSPALTPFGDSDFLLEEVDAFLALEDDPTSPKVDDSYYDPEGDILLLESFLNDDPSPLLTKKIIFLKFEKN